MNYNLVRKPCYEFKLEKDALRLLDVTPLLTSPPVALPIDDPIGQEL
jgi:hypothetical protein